MSGSPVWHRPTPQREEPSIGSYCHTPLLECAARYCSLSAKSGSVTQREIEWSTMRAIEPASKGLEAVLGRPMITDASYSTGSGAMFQSTLETFLKSEHARSIRGKVQLILTSPPFPLTRTKKYGNIMGNEYVEWLASLATPLAELLTPEGSIVVEIGNTWERGKPVMSTLPLRSLLRFLERANLSLCQTFISYNPARLPSPAQWVTVERIRVKDSYTHVWWMSKTERPSASNRNVLVEYSPHMRSLLQRSDGVRSQRPSGHSVGPSFMRDNGGAIPSNVLQFSNTASNDAYSRFCSTHAISRHPAIMPAGVVEFFVRLLTGEGDLVFDPFAGSNTTGAVAERLGRYWCGCEPEPSYIEGSLGRFVVESIRCHEPGNPWLQDYS
jgi:hypothetical protein